MANERRDLASLRAYAAQRAAIDPIPRGLWKNGVGGIMSLAIVVGTAAATMELLGNSFFSWMLTLMSIVVGPVLITALDSSIRQPRSDLERHQVQLHSLLKEIANMGKRRVEREIDPIAGQILEACAMQRERVLMALNSAAWITRASNEPWRSVREQSLQAAESAMEEAIVLSSPFIGPGRGKEEGEWAKVVSDFAEKGVGAAIRQVDRILSPRPALSDQNVPAPLRPALAVATKLQALADEVEMGADAATAATVSAAGSSLDQALQNLKAIQQAEQELDGTQVQQRLQ